MRGRGLRRVGVRAAAEGVQVAAQVAAAVAQRGGVQVSERFPGAAGDVVAEGVVVGPGGALAAAHQVDVIANRVVDEQRREFAGLVGQVGQLGPGVVADVVDVEGAVAKVVAADVKFIAHHHVTGGGEADASQRRARAPGVCGDVVGVDGGVAQEAAVGAAAGPDEGVTVGGDAASAQAQGLRP